MFSDPDRDDLEAVDDYDVDPSLMEAFWEGTPIGEWPSGAVKLCLNEGEAADLLGNPISWVIVSSRLREVLKKTATESIQIFPVAVTRGDKTSPSDYFVVNLLHVVDAVAGDSQDRSKLGINQIVLDAKRIPEGIELFRLKT